MTDYCTSEERLGKQRKLEWLLSLLTMLTIVVIMILGCALTALITTGVTENGNYNTALSKAAAKATKDA